MPRDITASSTMGRMQRRTFFGLLAASGSAAAPEPLGLSSLPNFCSHEHWGSISSIGTIPGGFRCDYEQGARPTRSTGLFDLVIDSYMRSLVAPGVPTELLARGSGSEWFTSLRKALQPYLYSGIFQ